jgi:hypothetical protein
MGVIAVTAPIHGTAGTAIPCAGAPTNGTSAIDTITIGGAPTAGAGSGITFTFDGYTTALALWSATNATLVANIDAALEVLPNTGAGSFTTAVGTMTAGVGTITVTYAANFATKGGIGPIGVGVNSMTGAAPTVAVANTTPGVTATARGQGPGALLSDVTNGIAYINTGTALSPTWTKVGTQT